VLHTPVRRARRGFGGRGLEGCRARPVGHPFGLRAAAAWPRVSVSGVPDRRRCRWGGYELRVMVTALATMVGYDGGLRWWVTMG